MSTDHAPPQAPLEADLERLYRSWRILDLVGETAAQLPPEWLQVLNLARNLVEGLPPPGVEIPQPLMHMVREDPEFTIIKRVQRKRRIVHSITGDTIVQPLRDLRDLPQVAPPDLLLRRLSAELFDYQLLSGNVHGVYNVDPGPQVEEWDETVEERIPIPSARRRRRQRIYVLFDISSSMREANKILFAKALLLAYLLTASEEGAHIYFRSFANSLHRRTDCLSLESFGELAQRVLRIEPEGSTDIRVALTAAIGEINALDGVGRERQAFQRSSTELLLISDCESYSVPQIPRGVSLHTIHLKGGQMAQAYREGFALVRAASTSFFEIDTTRLVLPETLRERWLLQQDGRRWELPGEDGPATSAAGRLERRNQLLGVYERMDEAAPADALPAGIRRGRGTRQRASLTDLLRVLWLLMRRLLPRRRVATPPARAQSFGLDFRVRR